MYQEAPSSSSSSISKRWTYDVFLSFRGEDTRKNFTDRLYHALKDAGVNAFRDDNELRRGEDLSSELLQAIQNSRISVVVFSENYGSSRWCLEELVKIMVCRKTLGQLVLPIFYDVDPSDVRKQTGSFEAAFAKHEKRFEKAKVEGWRTALAEAGSLSGWDLRNTSDWLETEAIKIVIQTILNELKHTYLNVATYPVGLASRLEDINTLLMLRGLDGVRFIGICGMGGIGKTTLAKAVYNQLFLNFEGKSFVANVRENSRNLVRLQEQLLCDILKLENIKLGNVHRGINVVKERLSNRKVLIILDDVSHADQIKALANEHAWFGSGSRIIITTRDQDLLKEIKVDAIYTAEELTDDESLELFSWHAFGNSHPKEQFVELTKDIVKYCRGVPLALEVLGSFLVDRNVIQWKSAIEKLRRIPHTDIQKQLRISFDALEDDTVKDIFLDIACFFIGVSKDTIVKILDACDFFAEIGISILIKKCLVKIGGNNKLMMHDLLRDMGREIIREESPKNPGKRSRLWFCEDVLTTLTRNLGTDNVEGIVLDKKEISEVKISTEAFSRMRRLRLLWLNYTDAHGKFDLLPKDLRWLCWHKFPLNFIPGDFDISKLVVLDMKYSKLKELWKGRKILPNLKVLKLSYSYLLVRTPNFSDLPNLERLILKDCTNLVEIHQSIGSLQRLEELNLQGCKKIKNFPNSICMVKSLQILNISGCLNIDKLPECIGEMESLTEFLADETTISQIPLSIVRLKNLTKLSLCGRKTLDSRSSWSFIWSRISAREVPQRNKTLVTSLSGLSSLKSLKLVDCNLVDGTIPMGISNLALLEDLDLRKNKFCNIPDGIDSLSKLKYLRLDDCPQLESLPSMPTNLYSVSAVNCISLERISMSGFRHVPRIILSNCPKLEDISGLDKLRSASIIHMEQCNNLRSNFKEFLLQDWCGYGYGEVFLPGREIPEWFSYQTTSSSLFFQIPPLGDCKLQGFTVCVVFASKPFTNNGLTPFPYVRIINRTGSGSLSHFPDENIPICSEDHMWVFHIPRFRISDSLRSEDQVEVVVEDFDGGAEVKQLGVHFGDQVCPHCRLYGSRETVASSSAQVKNMKMIEYEPPSTGTTNDSPQEHGGASLKRDHVDHEIGGSQTCSEEKKPSKRMRCDLEVDEMDIIEEDEDE